jgi:hypothetical protein
MSTSFHHDVVALAGDGDAPPLVIDAPRFEDVRDETAVGVRRGEHIACGSASMWCRPVSERGWPTVFVHLNRRGAGEVQGSKSINA